MTSPTPNSLYVASYDYGKERRKYIRDWFNQNPSGMYAVNCKHRPQVKDDPDLTKLIRIRFLKQIRKHTNSTHAMTFLVRADNDMAHR
jgi:hypothetical protein